MCEGLIFLLLALDLYFRGSDGIVSSIYPPLSCLPTTTLCIFLVSLTMTAFTSIPTLSLAEAYALETKPAFLEKLRHALVHVGFLYLEDTGISKQLLQDTIVQCRAFFDELPDEEKMRIEMKNVKSFLGYSRVWLSGMSSQQIIPPSSY